MYPAWKPENTLEVDTIEEQISWLNVLQGAGLNVLPKETDAKKPVYDFWAKDGQYYKVPSKTVNLRKYLERGSAWGWCVQTGKMSGDLVVIDLDPAEMKKAGLNPEEVYNHIQRLCPTPVVFWSPSLGAHLYYRSSERARLGNSTNDVYGVDFRGDGGHVVTVGGYNLYEDDYAQTKGVPNGHYATYSPAPTAIVNGVLAEIPVMNEAILEWSKTKHKTAQKHTESDKRARIAYKFSKGDEGSNTTKVHRAQSLEKQKSVTLELTKYVADRWGSRGYNEWVQFWMSAYDGSRGDTAVLDVMLTSTGILWKDGERGKDALVRAWQTHEHNDEGYTFASLKWIAVNEGYATQSELELGISDFTDIFNHQYISDWLQEIGSSSYPHRLLLKSQTGSGKTYAFSFLWRQLIRPKTVIFVPTRRLAKQLSSELQTKFHMNEHVLCYLDDNDNIRPHEELFSAKVLVITLQSFANHILPNYGVGSYELAYIEECDQIFKSFGMAGAGKDPFVSADMALRGFEALNSLLSTVSYVWGVDATMTKVSHVVFKELSKTTPYRVRVANNIYTKEKPHTKFVEDRSAGLSEVLDTITAGGRVVIAADTLRATQEIYDLIIGNTPIARRDVLLINSETVNTQAAKNFFRDANTWAVATPVIIYSPAIASGVSVTSIKPDLIYQECTYLAPRQNLQMLNRWRNQGRVLVFFKTPERGIYSDDYNTIQLRAAQKIAELEKLVYIHRDNKTVAAEIHDSLHLLILADEASQLRVPLAFYRNLLEEDGRLVSYADNEPEDMVDELLSELKAQAKELLELVVRQWRTYLPVDRNTPVEVIRTLTLEELVGGRVHAQVLRGIPVPPPDVDDLTVYEVNKAFGNKGAIFASLLDPEKALNRLASKLANRNISNAVIRYDMLIKKLLGDIGELVFVEGLDTSITEDVMDGRLLQFLNIIERNKVQYDLLVSPRYRFDTLKIKNAQAGKDEITLAYKVLKQVMGIVGLRLNKDKDKQVRIEGKRVWKYAYRVANFDQFMLYMSWVWGVDHPSELRGLDEYAKEREDDFIAYQSFTEDERRLYHEKLRNGIGWYGGIAEGLKHGNIATEVD